MKAASGQVRRSVLSAAAAFKEGRPRITSAKSAVPLHPLGSVAGTVKAFVPTVRGVPLISPSAAVTEDKPQWISSRELVAALNRASC